jgi:predicted permease
MRWRYKLPLRLRSLFRKKRVDQELSEELRFHLERLIEDEVAKGMAAEEARYLALRELGGIEQIKEECRDMRRVNYVEDLLRDFGFGLRQLRRNPGFTAVAVITLALGIGANTAIFSMVNSIMLRALPYRQPQQLYVINESVRQWVGNSPWGAYFPVNAGNFLLWQHECPAISVMALIGPATLNMTGKGMPRQVRGLRVSADLFSIMGIRPQLGRVFLPEEDQLGRDHEVILTAQFWQQVYNSDRQVIGKSITLDNLPYTVVGIMPENFRFPQLPQLGNETPELFKPIGFEPWNLWSGLGGFNFLAVARLKAGANPQQALAQLNVVEARIARKGDAKRGIAPGEVDLSAILRPLKTVILGPAQRALWMLMFAAAFVLLIICVNLANLTLVKNVGRAHEVAIRSALGATSRRLVRQFFAEGFLLATAGGGLGLLFAVGALQLLVRNAPVNIPRLGAVHISLPVLLFTMVIAVATALLFALLPALRLAGVRPLDALKTLGPATTGTHASARLRAGLVIGEIALCGILLAGALLLIESLRHVARANQWMDEEHVLAADLALPPNETRSTQQVSEFLSKVLERVRAIPGVRSAGFTSALPLLGPSFGDEIDVRELPPPPGKREIGQFRFVSPGYFQTINLPLVRGRFLSEDDRGKNVALISQSVVRKFLHGRDPVGMHLLWSGNGTPEPRDIIGEVGDVRNASDEPPTPAVYLPTWTFYQTSETLVVRTAMNPRDAAASIRRASWSVDPQVAIPRERTLKTIVMTSEATRRYETLLGTIFAVFALVLAAVGLYGVISYSVSQRTHEIGIRMALGAQRSDVLKMVIRDGLKLVVLGIASGIAGAFGLARLISNLLFGVKPDDPLTFALVAFVLLVVGFLATYAPANRVTKVDPTVALRYE